MATILVAEDSPNVLLTIKMCLELAGYEVVTASNGVEALQTAVKEVPDLVLLDIVLPGMSGYLVLEALRSEPLTKTIPVVMISARAQEEDIQKASLLGATDYIVKPFMPESLLTVVRKVLEVNNGGAAI